MHLNERLADRKQNEGDQRDPRHAIGFEPVGGWSHRVAGVVTRAIGDHAGVADVVLFDLEHDLHQVAADVGDLGKNSACHAQRRRAERFPDGETDKARARQVARHEEQNEEHDQQLDRHQQHPDAHSRLERNLIARERFAAQRRERGPRIGEGVDPHAERGHAEAARNADHAEQENDRHLVHLEALQQTEIKDDDDRNEGFQQQQEFPLRDEIGLASFENELGHLAHGGVHGHVPQADENHEAENQAQCADHKAAHQKRVPVDAAQERGGTQIRKLEVRFAASGFLRHQRRRGQAEQSEQRAQRAARHTGRIRTKEHRQRSSHWIPRSSQTGSSKLLEEPAPTV